MPNSFGHAKDFFKVGPMMGRKCGCGIDSMQESEERKPKAEDLLVFDGWWVIPMHVCIVSWWVSIELEIVQQNPGFWGSSRSGMG